MEKNLEGLNLLNNFKSKNHKKTNDFLSGSSSTNTLSKTHPLNINNYSGTEIDLTYRNSEVPNLKQSLNQVEQSIEKLINSIKSKLNCFLNIVNSKINSQEFLEDENNKFSPELKILARIESLTENLIQGKTLDFSFLNEKLTFKNFQSDEKTFRGFFSQDLSSGFGMITEGNNTYIGCISEKQYEGLGVMHTELKRIYIGYWKAGKREGPGTFIFTDGAEFTVEFENGCINSWGIKKYCNGDLYKGKFVNNLRSGKGTYFYKTSEFNDYDFGIWENGKFLKGWVKRGNNIYNKS